MTRELDTVVLTHHMPEHGLNEGDIGTVVHAYQDSSSFEVEFVTAGGQTIAVLTLTAENVRLHKTRKDAGRRSRQTSSGFRFAQQAPPLHDDAHLRLPHKRGSPPRGQTDKSHTGNADFLV